MKKKNLFKFLHLCMLAFVLVPETATTQAGSKPYSVYQIQPGDTVSDVLWRLQIIPVYGKRGMLNKVVEMNAGKVLENGDLIFPNRTILLPISSEELAVRLEESNRSPAQAESTISTAPVEASLTAESSAPVQQSAVVVIKKEIVPPEAPQAPLPAAPVVMPPVPPPVAPVVVSPPSPAPAPTPVEEFLPFSEIIVGAQGDYSALSGQDRTTGTSGKLLSRLNSSARVRWSQNWSADFATYLMADSRSMIFEPETHGINIYNSHIQAFHFGLGLESKLGVNSALDASASFGDEIFYRGYLGGGGGVEINPITIGRLRLGYKQTWVRRHSLSLLTDVGLTYLSSSSYDNYQIESGFAGDTGLYIRQDFSSKDFACGVLYAERRQNTSLILLNEKSLGVRCTLGWSL